MYFAGGLVGNPLSARVQVARKAADRAVAAATQVGRAADRAVAAATQVARGCEMACLLGVLLAVSGKRVTLQGRSGDSCGALRAITPLRFGRVPKSEAS